MKYLHQTFNMSSSTLENKKKDIHFAKYLYEIIKS